MDVVDYNRTAWDQQVAEQNHWTLPVSPEEVARARAGDVRVVLTPQKLVPREWLGPIKGETILCLASGGGQQGPLFAAAGGVVTVFDNSPSQLEQDKTVAAREGLELATVQGDMKDLGCFADESFDFIFHPSSNTFIADVKPVWREAYRVLKCGGSMVAGFMNPVYFLFDDQEARKGKLVARHKIPYSDVGSLSAEERQFYIDRKEPLCWGHPLEDQIGGQLAAGFLLAGFFEDYGRDTPQDKHPINQLMPSHIATRALKLPAPRR